MENLIVQLYRSNFNRNESAFADFIFKIRCSYRPSMYPATPLSDGTKLFKSKYYSRYLLIKDS